MKKNIILGVIIAVVSFAAYVGLSAITNDDRAVSYEEGYKIVAQKGFKGLILAAEFHQKIAAEEYVVLDIRTPEEYTEQRIVNDALLVDFYASDFKEQLNLLDKNQKYLVHCRSGARSSNAVKIMEDLGFTEFYELEGGINSWNQSGLLTYSGDDSADTEPVLDIDPIIISEPENETVPTLPVMCTMDAMMCPDGSSVGRTGPNCEFVCPDFDLDVEKKKPLSTTEASSFGWWKPKVGLSWQWQLSGTVNTSYDVDVYDIDLFETSAETISSLQAHGIKVLCYFSAGSYEDWRPDESDFPSSVLGKKLDDWEGERWLDISSYKSFANVMIARLDLAKSKGCDGVEPDNIDGYANDTGFNLSPADQIDYNTFLANEAHERGLAIALKNDVDQVSSLVSVFDMAVNEECFQYDECDLMTPFIKAGKPVFGVEYELKLSEFCTEAQKLQFSWLEMGYDLDGGRMSCDDYKR